MLAQDKVKIKSLSTVFSPRGVAIVGVSQRDDYSFVRDLVQALKEAKFPAIYPVNPKYKEYLGLPCFPDLKSIPGAVDHVVVSIPADRILNLLDDCAAKGVNSVHLYTAGFSESKDSDSSELEQLILKKAREGDFRVIGPNCTGMFVAKSRLPIAPRTPMEPGPIAFLSQSGGHATDLAILGGPRGLRFSKIVSYGNALDIDESELLEYFSHDPDTDIIAAYIEGIKDGKRFFKILKEAATCKPVIIYKGGITEAGLRAAFSHTASITSSTFVFDAVCRLLNVIQVNDTEEITDVLALLSTHAVPQGIGVSVVGAGGGPSVLASDVLEKAGLRLPPLSAKVMAELKRFLPAEGGIFVNPVDALNLVSPEAIHSTLNILGKVSDIDVIVYHLGFHPLSRWSDGHLSLPSFLSEFTEAMVTAQQAINKPVILVLRPPPDFEGMEAFFAVQQALVNAGLPVFYSLHKAAKALMRVATWQERFKRKMAEEKLTAK